MEKYQEMFLVGAGSRAKSIEDMAAYDLESIERGETLGGHEYVSVYYTSFEFNNYEEDRKRLHKLTYFKDNSIEQHTVTLNKNGSKLLSVTSNSSNSRIGKISDCISLGIW
jgi:hypothetical protein